MAFSTSSPSVSLSTAVYFSGQHVSSAPISVKLPSQRRTNKTTATAAYVSERTAYHKVRATPPPSGGSLYDVLGIDSSATCREIKAAYRSLARVVHPDVDGRSSGHEFMKIHEAYATLSDPARRAHYDRILLTHRLNSSLAMTPSMARVSRSAAARYGGYAARKNWETDQCW